MPGPGRGRGRGMYLHRPPCTRMGMKLCAPCKFHSLMLVRQVRVLCARVGPLFLCSSLCCWLFRRWLIGPCTRSLTLYNSIRQLVVSLACPLYAAAVCFGGRKTSVLWLRPSVYNKNVLQQLHGSLCRAWCACESGRQWRHPHVCRLECRSKREARSQQTNLCFIVHCALGFHSILCSFNVHEHSLSASLCACTASSVHPDGAQSGCHTCKT